MLLEFPVYINSELTTPEILQKREYSLTFSTSSDCYSWQTNVRGQISLAVTIAKC